MRQKKSVGEVVSSLLDKLDLMLLIKCPKCKSLDYSREFLFKEGQIPYEPPISFPTRTILAHPLYEYECSHCNYKWYS